MMNTKLLLVLSSTLVLAGTAPAQSYEQLGADEPFGLIWFTGANGDPYPVMAWGATGVPGSRVEARFGLEELFYEGLPQLWPFANPWQLDNGAEVIGPGGDVMNPVACPEGFSFIADVWTTAWDRVGGPNFRTAQVTGNVEIVQDIHTTHIFSATLSYDPKTKKFVLRADLPAGTVARIKVNGVNGAQGPANGNGQLTLTSDWSGNPPAAGTVVEMEIVSGPVGAGAIFLNMTLR